MSISCVCTVQESKMNPKPDYGYDSYKGTGKLTGKIALITGADSGRGPVPMSREYVRSACCGLTIMVML